MSEQDEPGAEWTGSPTHEEPNANRTRRYLAGQSRRRFLQTAALTGAVAGFSVTVTGQLDTEIELGGRSDAWIGQSPEEIEDEENPTLTLEEGETYEVTWENLDGVGHNFVIIDDEGDHLVETEIITGEGETQSLEFEAEAEMAEYYCGPHPQTMRGDIEIGEPEEPEEEVEEEPERYFPEGPTVGVDPVAEGLIAPTDFEDPPGAEYQLVADQTGEIYAIDDGGREEEPWLDISDRMVAVAEDFYGDDYADPDQDYDERGLVGIESHPEYEENGRFYLNYSAPPVEEMPDDWSHVQVISEFQVDENGDPDPDSERRIIEFYMPQYNHNSGPMAFGPDGYFYVPMGDGGGADDRMDGHVDDWYDENEGGNGQDTTENLLGGVLRIDVDEDPTEHPARGSFIHLDMDEDAAAIEDDEGYAIPDDNPFAEGQELEGEGLEEYYAWGLRNPFGITFSEEGRLIVGDPGQVLFEPAYEIQRGGNYGWNVREGSHCFSTETPATPPEECPLETPDDVRGGEPLIDPVVEYPQVYEGEPVGIVIVGGHTYEADEIEELEGKYIFGDWTDDQGRMQPRGRVFAAEPEDVPDVSEERGEFGSRPREDLWEMEEVLFDGGEDGNLGHFVRQFGRGQDGEVYVLANQVGIPEGDTGVVFQLVPEGEGVDLEEPDVDEPEEPENDVAPDDEDDEPEEPENDVAPDDEDEPEEPENDVAPDDEDDEE
ncbi:PQQ-dependent sugar dehydrogenase [Natronobacterium texcoconense]|uniref:Tat (Twin-arginine translocation) pathway signal sequence n=1 Tax=Natronobacterium texcoconense TaxID=1095778 RepID=A0A1H1CSA0_NATTX|nr:PQQ-dependent sugar dehydrogenase [Natronobacterium texcoconense]SDQ67094.1 Tat (twin-arginine translocation) pathway signal sequence [Natronobacterium texcoconense]